MDTECAPGDNDKRVVLPGGVVDGEMTTREYDILDLKKDRLKELCRAYGLSTSGKKELLQGRLQAFSADREDWDRLNPQPRRMHRGPKAGKITKPKAVKQSVRRANEVFRSETNTHVPHLPYQLPEPEATTSLNQANAFYDWAKAISTAHPYVSKEDRIKAGQARQRKQALAQQYIIYPTFVPPPVLSASEPCGSSSTPADAVQSPWSPFPAPDHLVSSPMTTSTSSLPPPSSLSHRKPATRSLTLRNGTCIEFTADEAGPPPAISFAENLPGLNRMWDDKGSEWDGHSALVIKGIPIPIVYWREVYGRSKSDKSGKAWRVGDWKKIKGMWSEWKLVVLKWRQSNEVNFWKEFSDSRGRRLNYKTIVRRLTQIRMTEDKRLADEARNRYGSTFSSIFSYRKSGVVHVKTKDCDIAKQYRRELTKIDPLTHYHSEEMDIDSD